MSGLPPQTPDSMATANSSKKLSRGPRITWTHEMRVTLHLIISEFGLAGEQRADVFNTVFADKLVQFGLPEGADGNRLRIQYAMRVPGKSKEWPAVMAAPTSPDEIALRQSVRAQIEQAVQKVETSHARPPTTRNVPQQYAEPPARGDNMRAARVIHTPLRSSVRPRPQQLLNQDDIRQTPSPIKRSAFFEDDSDVEPAVGRSSRARTSDRKRSRIQDSASQPLFASIDRATIVRTPVAKVAKSPGRKPRTPTAKLVFAQGDGKQILVSEPRMKTLGKELVRLAQNAAQPPLPELLFRYYEERTPCDHNSEDGFVARKWFQGMPPLPPPKSSGVDWQDVLNHMDRRMQDSPFISTCNKLLWIVQLASKEANRGVENGRIAIIDPAAIGKQAIFWARPYHKEIADKTAAFRNGAFRYCGTNEFLVWASIPKEAIIATVKVTDLLRLPLSQPIIGDILRFDVLSGRASLTKKEAAFKSQNLSLDGKTASGIAKLARFLGLTANSPVQHLSHIVADVVRGWQLKATPQEPQAWRKLASDFARSIAGDHWIEPEQQQSLKMAFLDGVRWAQGAFNARHSVETMTAMQKKARVIGLEFPAKIIAGELDTWKLRLFTHENHVARLMGQSVQQSLHTGSPGDVGEIEEDGDGSVDSDDEDDVMPTPGPSRPRWSWTRRMRIERHGYEPDDGEEIAYEQ